MTISDSCSDLNQHIQRFLSDIDRYTAPGYPLRYPESIKQRVALICADLEALRAELDHSPSNDYPAPKFDPITPRLQSLEVQAIKWRNSDQLSHYDSTAIEFIANTAMSLPRWLKDMDVDIWEEPTHE